MKACKLGELLLLLAMLPACGQQLVEFPQTDGASPDAGMADVLIVDAAIPDAAIADGAIIDVPTIDAPRADAATTDLGSTDGSGPGPAVVIDLGLARPFAIVATAGVANTMTSPTIGAAACGRSMAGRGRVAPGRSSSTRMWFPCRAMGARSRGSPFSHHI
jgi:hypothetical protein